VSSSYRLGKGYRFDIPKFPGHSYLRRFPACVQEAFMQASRAALAQLRKGAITAVDLQRTICRDIVQNVGSTRASIWLFNPLKDQITCAMLFDSRTGGFHTGAVLKADDFPDYFKAIERDLEIVAPDAANHPATKCFDEVYFVPNDIHSLLDHVVMQNEQPYAVQCCEHCGEIKNWSSDNIEYLHQMSSLLTWAFKIAT
jgi:GAF domain-containing protein